ncbi:hypothetical protein D9M71_128970 [compost metagenome]
MHEPGIVGHHRIGARHQVDSLGQRSITAEIDRFFAQPRNQALTNRLADRVIVLRAEQPDLPAFANLDFGNLGVMLRRPALGLTEFGPGAQRQHRPVQAQAEFGQGRGTTGPVDLQARARVRLGQLGLRLIGQGHEALDHQRIAFFIQRTHIVEQAVAHFATPAGALGNAGEERHQRRFQ